MSVRRLVLLSGIVVGGCAPRALVQPSSSAPFAVVLPQADSGDRARAAQNNAAPLAPRDSSGRVSAPVTAAGSGAVETVVAALTPDPVAAEAADVFPMLSLDQYATRDRVDYYVKLFTGNAKSRMGERLSAGTRYATLIRDKLRAGGIPEEITYLALIESGYDPDAYSSAAAVGMWQFMTGTARGYGLRVDWWIDERRDPVRATDAAIKYLNELRGQFGSIYLAAAAYNGGAGRVSRGLSRLAQDIGGTEPDDQFFTLASTKLLREETRNYVPQLIAAALIGREPSAYGIVVDTLAAIAFDSVSVPPATGLGAVAKACETELSDILDLNGQVLRGMTPPDGGGVWLRVPVRCGPSFAESFAALDTADRRGARVHTVKKGETPSSIAKNAGLTLTTWRRYNPKVKATGGSALPSGQQVLIPTRETLRAARDVPDPAIERYGVATGGVYEVRRGDTLGRIAERNHTTVSALKRINGLRSDRISIGQKLRVRG
jgi:membrane-bound lytic murein transglycosylase D